jgi:hypothetical protein
MEIFSRGPLEALLFFSDIIKPTTAVYTSIDDAMIHPHGWQVWFIGFGTFKDNIRILTILNTDTYIQSTKHTSEHVQSHRHMHETKDQIRGGS